MDKSQGSQYNKHIPHIINISQGSHENKDRSDETTSSCSFHSRSSNSSKKKKRRMPDSKNEIIKKLHICAKAGNPQQTEQFLKQMQTLYEAGDEDMRPDFRHYNSMMHAWVKSENTADKEFRAQSILEWMCNLQKNNPRSVEYTHLKPTNISFNICINAWSKSKEKNSTDVAWYLFELMQSMKEEGHISYGPDYHTCKVIIHALSNNVEEGTARKATRVLDLMHDSINCKPDASIYNQIMHIYSHNKENNAPQKGEALLTTMHQRYIAGEEDLKPTTLTFNTLLNTYAKSKIDSAADRAEMILQHMQELYESGLNDVCPDVISFNTVINAHASSHKKGADTRAFNLLSKMKELHAIGRVTAVPNVRTYNACMKACLCSCNDINTSTSEKEASMKIACDLLSQMHYENISADEHTYHWFFKACQYLCTDDLALKSRFHWAYELCYKSGVLNDRLYQQIQHMNRITNHHHYFQPHFSWGPPNESNGEKKEYFVRSSSSRNQEIHNSFTNNSPWAFESSDFEESMDGPTSRNQDLDSHSTANSSHWAQELGGFGEVVDSHRQAYPIHQNTVSYTSVASSNDSTITSSLYSHEESIDLSAHQKTPTQSHSTPCPVSLPSVISVDGSNNMWAYKPTPPQTNGAISEKKWTYRVEAPNHMSITHTIPE